MSFNGENNFHKLIFSNLNHFNWQREIAEEGKKKIPGSIWLGSDAAYLFAF
jgi:hypothetical protein